MIIRFQSKEESNRQQREAFLKLSPSERSMSFLALSRRMLDFPTQKKDDEEKAKTHFVLERKKH